MACSCDPSMGEAEAGGLHKVKGSLCYRVSSRLDETLSHKNKETQEELEENFKTVCICSHIHNIVYNECFCQCV